MPETGDDPMTYQALARTWRPQDFTALVGQEPVVTALTHALRDERIAHAYLFAGIRGVGKTSAARILAKALNCERGPTPEPCGECLPCREITAGSDLDVLEIDAATHSKVDQVRELTESLRYGPARDRYKVVVLDEVHRLSRQAFDALLKIVEEPPAHLVFIFATTEIEAVPATLLSRTQEYRFRRVPVAQLTPHLETICDAEGIDASGPALRLIARAGEGSVRDAVALLDQLATYGGGAVDDADAANLVGAFDPDLFYDLLDAITGGDRSTIVAALDRVEREGWDPKLMFGRLTAYCRDALHLAVDDEATVDLPQEERRRLAELAADLGFEATLRLLDHLLDSEDLVRRSERSALAVEIALLRAAELPRLLAVVALLESDALSGSASAAADDGDTEPRTRAPSTESSASTDSSTDSSKDRLPASDDAATTAAAPGDAPPGDDAAAHTGEDEPEQPPASEPADDTDTTAPPAAAPATSRVDRLLAEISRRRQVLAAHLEQTEHLHFEGDTLVVVRPPDDRWLERALHRGGNRDALEAALAEVAGEAASWRLVEGDGDESPPDDGLIDEARRDPRVQTVLDIFDGSIRGIDPNPPAKERS